jgi:hypothetical protein
MTFTLLKVRLNQGGYTRVGRYFGIGLPLYYYCSSDYNTEGYVRASDRNKAKALVANIDSSATFNR